ncbi:MAG: hypothetical protein U9R39_06425 [Campylobacterota bacterium]|nr:hypothetical protein [Campylobacterota bacterium]
MFILIPTIIIFLSLSYLHLNDDVGITTQIILYLLMITTTIISLYLYKKVKSDMNIQDLNSIKIEIQRLTQKLNNTKEENIKLGLMRKIELLEQEMMKHK